MTRAAMTSQALPGAYEAAVVQTFHSFDHTNGMTAPCTGNELISISNASGSDRVITWNAVPDETQRSVDGTATVPTGQTWRLPKLKPKGWRQTDGTVQIDADGVVSYCLEIEPPQ